MKKIWIAALIVLALVGAYAVYAQSAENAGNAGQPATNGTAQPPAGSTDAPQSAVDESAQPEATDGTENPEEETQEIQTLTGEILEVGGDFILLRDEQLGEVHINFTEDTEFEGAGRETLVAGQYAVVLYNGVMTRSLPPIATAMKVGVYEITGAVAQVQEDGRVLIDRADVSSQVLATLPEGAQTPEVGETITLYTNGVMTLSLPAQVNAIGVKK